MIRALLAALALVTAVVVGPGAAAAATAPAAQDAVRLEVVEQSPVVADEGYYVLRLAWDGPMVDHRLRVRIFQVVDDEADLEERTPSGQLNQFPLEGSIPLPDVERDARGLLVVRIPVRSLPLPAGDPSRVYLPMAGVYPLEIEITGPAEEKVASAFATLIRLPADPDEIEPVPVAVVLAVGPAGVPLADAVELLDAAPDVPVTTVVAPSTLEQAAEQDPALLERFRQAVGDRHVVAASPVPVDVSALAEVGHLDLYDDIRDAGVERVGELLGRRVRADVLLDDEAPTAAAAAHLARGDAVLVTPAGTEDGAVVTRSGRLPVLSPDEDLMTALARPSHDGYHVLARLAVRFYQGDTTPVLLTAGPNGVGAADLGVVLGALARRGIATAVPLDEVAEQITTRVPPRERPRQDLRRTASLLEAALDDLREYTTFHVSGPLAPTYLENRVRAALAVDVAPEQRNERLAAVRSDIAEAFDVISVPEGRTVNLAATTSPLPLTVTNEASGPRRVRITFSSDKLTFPQEEGGSRLVELGAGTSALDFVVESRSLGVLPLDVVISTPDGSHELARTRITIRSTAVPGLGLLLSGAALVFLVGWWAVHLGRGRIGHEARSAEPVP